MARKIRFPLQLKDNAEVRDIEELKQHFSLEKVLACIENGKMDIWLRDRYHNDIADEIRLLNKNSADYKKEVCKIFGVAYEEEKELSAAEEYAQRLNLLKRYTDDKSYLDKIDFVAFSQEELYDLLAEDTDTVYLCGESFSIPLGRENMRYIGINQPVVNFSAKSIADVKKRNIIFENVSFNEAYQSLLNKASECSATEDTPPVQPPLPTEILGYGEYKESYIGFLLPTQDRVTSQQLYQTLVEYMETVHYNIDTDIQELRENLINSGVVGTAKNFLENF